MNSTIGQKIIMATLAIVLVLGTLLGGVAFAFADDEQKTYEVDYTGRDGGFVAMIDDFFSHQGSLMPGDDLTGSILITNKSDNTAEFFFAARDAELDLSTSDAAALLEQMPLVVADGEEIIYEGTLNAADSAEGVSVGTLLPGESLTLDFGTSLPTTIDNEHARAAASVVWLISAQAEEAQADQSSPSGNQTTTGSTSASSTGSFDKTGVDLGLATALAAAAALIATLIILRTRNTKNDKQQAKGVDHE